MEEKRLNLGKKSLENNRLSILYRLLLISAILMAFLIFFNFISFYIISSLLVFILTYILFRKCVWIFLVFTIPALIFGQFIDFEIRPNWIYEISLAEIFIILTSLIFLFHKFLIKKIGEIKINFLSFSLFFYLIISIASFWHIIDFKLYVAGLKVIVFSFLSYFLAFNILNNKKKIKWFLYGLSTATFILSIQIFIKFYNMGFSKEFFFNRSFIMIPIGPIALVSSILAILLPIVLAFYFYINNDNKFKPISFFSFAFSWTAIFLTLGKSAILSLALGLSYFFLKLKDKRIIAALSISLFFILSYIFFMPFFSGLYERVVNTFVDKNTDFRILEYKVCWKIIKDNLWFGVGSGQQLLHYSKMLYPDYRQWVNNFFLQSFVDLGVFGLSILLLIIGNIFRLIRKVKNKISIKNEIIIYYGFIASFIIAFLGGMFEVTFFAIPYAIIFWLCLGVFSNLGNLDNEK